MKKNSVEIIISLLLVAFYPPVSVFAESIVFKWGAKVEAEIIEKTDDYIKT